MTLLYDQNLSSRLVRLLADLYPAALHVREVGLHEGDDAAIWSLAADRGLTIVSKDADFHQLSILRGHPPKVIWLRCGNASTDAVAALLRKHHRTVRDFHADADAALLVLS